MNDTDQNDISEEPTDGTEPAGNTESTTDTDAPQTQAEPEALEPTGPTFADLGLHPALVRAVSDLGYQEPTPIQAEAIPVLLTGRDLLGLAATGTGKTAAFTLPMLHHIASGETGHAPNDRRPQGLVLVPTRELARQAARAASGYAQHLPISVLEVYGGASMRQQLSALRRGVDVVVGTPGRVKDHVERGSLDLSALAVVVLDEADEMLDMGFQEDMEAILNAASGDEQSALFSATFPPRLRDIAGRHLNDPQKIEVRGKSDGHKPDIREVVHVVHRSDKALALSRVLDMEGPEAALVFCRTRADVDGLAAELDRSGARVEALHGGLSQNERDRVMYRLREGIASLVIATDVAARGLDVDRLSHVVNFDMPEAPEQYVHRIGRTGRAGRKGVAITLAEPRDRRRFKNIERLVKRRIPVAPVPSVSDLRQARLRRLGQRVVDVHEADEPVLEPYLGLAEDMADERDATELLAAALRALAVATGQEGGEEIEIADASRSGQRSPYRQRQDRGGDRDRSYDRRAPPRRDGPPQGGNRGGFGRGPQQGWARVFVGLGGDAGMRPKDLVGAIAGETRLNGRDVGAIKIFSRFCLVDVPSGSEREVIEALRNTSLRGRRVMVRLDRDS